MRQNHDPACINYINTVFANETPHMQQVRLKGEEVLAGMQISPHEGKLLYVLAKMIAAKNILEIGTFVGYSTLWLADSLPDDGRITTIELRPEQAEIARNHFATSPHNHKINILEGRALDILATIRHHINGNYDMIFIDAAKAQYYEYVQICEPLLRVGGLMLLDNSLLFGNVYHDDNYPSDNNLGDNYSSNICKVAKKSSPAAIASVRAANEYLAQNYDAILIPTEEGLTVAMKKHQF